MDITITFTNSLFEQSQRLAQQLDVAHERLVEIAVERFVQNHSASVAPSTHAEAQIPEKSRAVNQGEVYWVQLDEPDGLEARIPHPQVVVQDDVLNHSRISTVVVCGLTSNLRRANGPGNVLLEAGEANLPRQSVVEVSKVSTVAKTQLGDYIGSLSEQRLQQIFTGMRFLQRSFYR